MKDTKFKPTKSFLEKAKKEFAEKGGKITKLPYIEINWLNWGNIDEFFGLDPFEFSKGATE